MMNLCTDFPTSRQQISRIEAFRSYGKKPCSGAGAKFDFFCGPGSVQGGRIFQPLPAP
jgi:hypothetical protein